MQTLYKNKDEKDDSGEADSIGIIIYTRRISRYLKEENVIEDLENRSLEFIIVGDFLLI